MNIPHIEALAEAGAGVRLAVIEPLPPVDAERARRSIESLSQALERYQAERVTVKMTHGGAQPEPTQLDLPPVALRLLGRVLEFLCEGRPLFVVSPDHELTTRDAAKILNVSRSFVIKEVKAGNLPHHMVGTHRRIPYEALMRYRERMRASVRLDA